MPFIIISGNPVDGLHFTGPFADSDEAISFGEIEIETDWWIAPINQP